MSICLPVVHLLSLSKSCDGEHIDACVSICYLLVHPVMMNILLPAVHLLSLSKSCDNETFIVCCSIVIS